MQSWTFPLAEVLTREVRYSVPLFQRRYVWTGIQWWPLWTDVVETASRRLDDLSRGIPTTKPHFLGAVVHEGLPKRTGQLPEMRLIDGQQRMTTLQLLLAAITATAREDALAAPVGRLERLIANPDYAVTREDERYKVWPTNKDRPGFVAAMQGRPEHGPIGDAYRFLLQRVQAFVHHGDGGAGPDDSDDDAWLAPAISEAAEGADVAARADALVDTVRDLIRLVVIELEADKGDDPQVIFETLNSTGTPLLPSDLVKNHLFNRAQTAALDVDELDRRYWSDLADPWFAVEEAVGRRTDRTRLDLVIGFWTAFSNPRGADVTHSRLFDTFREVARARSGPATSPDPAAVEDLFRDLHHHATTYRSMRSAPYDSVEGRFTARLHDLNTTTPMPLVLWLAGLRPAVPRDQYERALRAVESYLVRRATCGMTAKNYNRVFAQTLESAKAVDLVAVGEAIEKHLANYREESVRWPDDDEFRTALEDEPQYRRPLRATRVRMVLEAIEAELRGPDVEQLAPPTGTIASDDAPTGTGRTAAGKSLTVEHILPQRWKETWPVPAGAEDPVAEAAHRDRVLHTLGNLTLVTGSKNAKMSNQPWAAKRSYLATASLLMLTQALTLALPLKPGEKRDHGVVGQEQVAFFTRLWETDPSLAIMYRGAAIAEWALRIWPRPESVDEM